MNIPDGQKYTKEHEWARKDGDLVVVGITDHAQHKLGDIVFVELPAVGAQVKAGATFGTVESVKAVSDLFAPLSGEVTAVNDALTNAPETVNKDPYGSAWMIKVKPSQASELDKLLSPADYEKLCDSEG
ncbi:MAG: glycine cleavage system protein GcvH [Deltaproteobacteria bacterium]|nr:glycine cleavage system protein GcvH [Deltaproteobacteria bacterium]